MEYSEVAPTWVLERQGSAGCLFWRREGPGARVKFRYDVEVREFRPSEEEHRVHCRVEDVEAPSPLTAAFCLAAMCALLGYQWMFPI